MSVNGVVVSMAVSTPELGTRRIGAFRPSSARTTRPSPSNAICRGDLSSKQSCRHARTPEGSLEAECNRRAASSAGGRAAGGHHSVVSRYSSPRVAAGPLRGVKGSPPGPTLDSRSSARPEESKALSTLHRVDDQRAHRRRMYTVCAAEGRAHLQIGRLKLPCVAFFWSSRNASPDRWMMSS